MYEKESCHLLTCDDMNHVHWHVVGKFVSFAKEVG